jgi:hypothetical protein
VQPGNRVCHEDQNTYEPSTHAEKGSSTATLNATPRLNRQEVLLLDYNRDGNVAVAGPRAFRALALLQVYGAVACGSRREWEDLLPGGGECASERWSATAGTDGQERWSGGVGARWVLFRQCGQVRRE